MKQLSLQDALKRDLPGVRGLLKAALELPSLSTEALVAREITHYTASFYLRRLQEAGEIDASGCWQAEAHRAYLDLLQAPAAAELQRLPAHEQPRERALDRGIDHLSERELLALLLRTGRAGEGVLELADRLLAENDGLVGLAGLDIEGLVQAAGLGPAKATEIAAAFAIGRRLAEWKRRSRPPLTSPEAVVELIAAHLIPLPHEEFWCLPLDPRSRLIGQPRVVSRGDVDGTDAGPRAFYRTALAARAVSAIAVHNHPTGEVSPSAADRAVTRRLAEAGRLLDIDLVDHLIIGSEGRFTSLRRTSPQLFASSG